MLIEFTVSNYRCFSKPTTLNLMATTLSEHPENVARVNVLGRKPKTAPVLKTAAIYGANASGKSSLIRALEFFCGFIRYSLTGSGDRKINVTPFLANKSYEEKPSGFELVFISNCITYRYGAEISEHKVHNEWLYHSPKGVESLIFERNNKSIRFGRSFGTAKIAEKMLKDNFLFISLASQTNFDFAKTVTDYVEKIVTYDPNTMTNTFNLIGGIAKEPIISILQEALKFADIGIDAVSREEVTLEDAIEFLKSNRTTGENVYNGDIEDFIEKFKAGSVGLYRLMFKHKCYTDEGEEDGTCEISHDFQSLGTMKYMALISLAVKAFLDGGVVVIDEFDASIHPLLADSFIRLFHTVCADRSQLIITTHNSLLLRNNIFRRDQIWLMEKNAHGEGHLTCLSDYKSRKDASLDKQYLAGMFGGVPALHTGYQERMIAHLNNTLQSVSNACTPEADNA